MKWTIEDMNLGLCDLEDLGNEKPEPEPEPAPAIDLSNGSLRERLRDDALRAYAELGGVEYLKRNPELLDKILAKAVVPEPAPPSVNVDVAVGVTMPEWVSARRLIYSEGLTVREDIKAIDVPTVPFENLPPRLQQEVEASRARPPYAGQEFDEKRAAAPTTPEAWKRDEQAEKHREALREVARRSVP